MSEQGKDAERLVPTPGSISGIGAARFKSDGPRLRVDASCFDCRHSRSERYAVQGDSGTDVYCDHPSELSTRYVGDTTWNTPDWCPLMVEAVARLAQKLATARSLPKSERPKSEASEPAPEAAHTDQGAR